MSAYVLRLVEDRIRPAGETEELAAEMRVIYVVEGDVTVTVRGRSQNFRADAAWFGTSACRLRGGAAQARLWRWELVRGPIWEDGVADGPGVVSELKLGEELTLNTTGSYMMRCDRVDFPLGGIAYTHTHMGPGIRCLLRGALTVRTDEREWTVQPGETWFERGPDPIYAEASSREATSFIRAMVLPRELKGQTSIRYIREEDQDKPKTQEYTRYVDEFIEL